MRTRAIIVLAGTRAQALRAARIRGIRADLILWPVTLVALTNHAARLAARGIVPRVIVDRTMWSHPWAESMAEWVASLTADRPTTRLRRNLPHPTIL